MNRDEWRGAVPLVAAVLAGWVGASGAQACSCAEAPSVQDAWRDSEAVFVGVVESIGLAQDALDAQDVVVRMSVAAAWKGAQEPQAQLRTARNEAACGVAFMTGREYLVYATRDGTGGLRTNLCTRTALKSRAAQDLTLLGPPLRHFARTALEPAPGPAPTPTSPDQAPYAPSAHKTPQRQGSPASTASDNPPATPVQ